MASRKLSEDVRCALCGVPGYVQRTAGKNLPADRDDLFTGKDSEQPDQCNQWRRWRADIEDAVDDADQQARGERKNVHLHGSEPFPTSRLVGARACRSAVTPRV